MNESVLNKNQPSITEWFVSIGEIKEAEAFRREDNAKSDRLETLYQTIGLHYEKPIKLEAQDLAGMRPVFRKILKERSTEHCAIRLVPKKDGLPKLRNRGMTIKKCFETWFLKQKINPKDYEAHICPHSRTLEWSIIFVVNREAIFGEIVKGLAFQLTHGNTYHEIHQFRFDYKKWQISKNNVLALKEAKKIVSKIKVTDKRKQNLLKEKLKTGFIHDYMSGYFEATVWPGDKINYIDYDRFLTGYIPTPPPLTNIKEKGVIKGISSAKGHIQGKVVVVKPTNIKKVKFPNNSILVCDYTDVRFLPLMKKSSAIITDRGGILSHAAIVSRELKIPCVIGTKIATRVLKDGNLVEVDATKGVVKKL